MNPQDTTSLTIYNDLYDILAERGYTDEQAMELILKLTTQAEMEVVEEILASLSPEQLSTLDNLPENASADDIIEKLSLDPEEVGAIRAQKTAHLIEQLAPQLNQ